MRIRHCNHTHSHFPAALFRPCASNAADRRGLAIMGSGCSQTCCSPPPFCESFPVARKWQGRVRRRGRRSTARNAKQSNAAPAVHLISSSRAPSDMLYANTPIIASATATRGGEGGSGGVPMWSIDHLLLLYNGVATLERSGGEEENTAVAMFHGFFGLAERQRREREVQQAYPF